MKKLGRRNFLKGLAVVGATISPVGKVVQLLELKCSNCSASLIITGAYSCECEYCGAKYAVTNLDQVLEDDGWDVCHCECHDSYFWDHDSYFWIDGCTKCDCASTGDWRKL